MRQFDEQTEKEICFLYDKNGETLSFLSQKYHCRTDAIKAVLLKYNIKMKPKGTSKNRLLKEDFFENIDMPEKAYFLGLLFADGFIVHDKARKRNPMIGIMLKLSDKDILEQFRNILQANGKITYDKRGKKECARFSFRNKKMASDLAKYGIIQNKTYLTKHLPKVPNEFLRDFIRGLVDGDGSIYQETKSKKYRIDFCSHYQSICEDFRQLCNTFLDKPNTNVIKNYGSAYHIRFNDQSSVKQLATVLYKGNTIALARKYEMAKRIFEDNNEEDIVYSDH